MTKVRTIQQLQDALDRDYSWRFYELTYLKRLLKPGKPELSHAGVRASTAILYAHWEGFIKCSAQLYLQYVSRQGHKISDLIDCFAYLALRQSIGELTDIKKAQKGIAVMRKIRSSLSSVDKFTSEIIVDTQSNLNSEVFKGVLAIVGFDDQGYAPYYNLIDETLLGNRNKIAHGEYVEIDAAGYVSLEHTILDLMRLFKSDIELAASNGSYRPQPLVSVPSPTP